MSKMKLKKKFIYAQKTSIFLLTGCLLIVFQNCDQKPSSEIGNSGNSIATAVSYYVDAVGGRDSDVGTSATNPWKTLAKISASTFPTGTVIYLKRGSVWYEQLTLTVSGLTFDAYGAGALPQINGAQALSGTWNNERLPAPAGADTFKHKLFKKLRLV